jgi:hypothetical protein
MGIRDWFRGARSAEDGEVREEIVFHLDRATQENIARGMGPEEARADALRRFGDLEQVRRDCLAARGRRVPPVVAWSAVAALAAVSFLSGYAVRSGGKHETPMDIEFAGGRRVVIETRQSDIPARLGVTVLPGRTMALFTPSFRREGDIDIEPARLLAGLSPILPPSPFSAWRWRDGVPEVKLDGEGWYELVSAAGIPAATLREENRKSQGLPAGVYLDCNPHVMILGNKGCKGPTVEIVLRSLADGGEVKVACAGGWVRVQKVPRLKWPKKEGK